MKSPPATRGEYGEYAEYMNWDRSLFIFHSVAPATSGSGKATRPDSTASGCSCASRWTLGRKDTVPSPQIETRALTRSSLTSESNVHSGGGSTSSTAASCSASVGAFVESDGVSVQPAQPVQGCGQCREWSAPILDIYRQRARSRVRKIDIRRKQHPTSVSTAVR